MPTTYLSRHSFLIVSPPAFGRKMRRKKWPDASQKIYEIHHPSETYPETDEIFCSSSQRIIGGCSTVHLIRLISAVQIPLTLWKGLTCLSLKGETSEKTDDDEILFVVLPNCHCVVCPIPSLALSFFFLASNTSFIYFSPKTEFLHCSAICHKKRKTSFKALKPVFNPNVNSTFGLLCLAKFLSFRSRG